MLTNLISEMGKRKYILFSAVLAVITLVFIVFLQMSTSDYYSTEQNEKYAVELSHISDKDMHSGGDAYVFTGKNPVTTFELDEGFYFINVKIWLSKPLENSERIVIDYADNDGNYTYWEGDVLYPHKGQNYIIAPLPDNRIIKTFTVAIEPTLYDYPVIERVTFQKSGKISKLAALYTWAKEDNRLLIDLLVAILFAVLFNAFIYYCDEKKLDSWKQKLAVNFIAVGIICLALFVVYQIFLCGNALFVFRDCAGDSAGLFYPTSINEAKWISNGVMGTGYDFSRGLGLDNYLMTTQFDNWISFFGVENVAYLRGVSAYLCSFIASVCMYFMATLYSENRKPALIIALATGVSADCTIRSAWPTYPMLIMFISFTLLAIELFVKREIWYVIPFAVVTFIIHSDTFYRLFWTVLLASYILFRFLLEWEKSKTWKQLIVAEIIYIVSCVAAEPDLISAVLGAVNSDRFQKGLSRASVGRELNDILQSGFGSIWISAEDFFTGFLRTIGQNITGITINYKGPSNYLMDLTLYCGVLVLLLVPVAIYNLKGKKRVWYGVAILACILYVLCKPFMLVMSAFTGMYKISSQWVVFFMLLIALELLALIMRGEVLRRGSLIIIGITDSIIFILSVVAIKLGFVLSQKLLAQSLLFLCLYSIMFAVYYFMCNRNKSFVKSVQTLLVVTFLAEVIIVSWPTFNDRMTYTKEYNPYMNDGSLEAVDYLKNIDDDFYRVEKQSVSMEDNDAYVQGFYGTRYYKGGGNNSPIYYIYDFLNLPHAANYKYNGASSDIYSLALLGTKYFMSKDNLLDKYGYSYIDRVEGVSIYSTDNYLPLIFYSDKVIDRSDFEQISSYSKKRNILKAIVVDDLTDNNVTRVYPDNYDVCDNIEKIEVNAVEGTYYPNISDEELLIVRFDSLIDMDNPEYMYTTITGQKEIVRFGCKRGEKVLEICVDNLESFSFVGTVDEHIENIEFYKTNRNDYYAEFVRDIIELKATKFDITYHDDYFNDIQGRVVCEKDGVLATQIVNDGLWTVDIDGERQEIINVNGGFIGCYVTEGPHEVRVSYGRPFVFKGNVTLMDWICYKFKLVKIIPISIGIMIVGFVVNLDMISKKRKVQNV